MQRNVLIVVQGHEHPLLLNDALVAQDLNWIVGRAPDAAQPYAAKTRYRQQDAACRITQLAHDQITLKFDAAQCAVTPGQSVVMYEGETCLGGGVIE